MDKEGRKGHTGPSYQARPASTPEEVSESFEYNPIRGHVAEDVGGRAANMFSYALGLDPESTAAIYKKTVQGSSYEKDDQKYGHGPVHKI